VVVAEAMADLEERAPKPLIMITGMMSTKDPVGFFKPFAGLAARVFTVPVAGHEAARAPEELAEAARAAGLVAEPAADVAAALDRIAAAGGDRPAAGADLRVALSRRAGARPERIAAYLSGG
jgi:dihydrofolate synthase / folylpolyglutamate synthase